MIDESGAGQFDPLANKRYAEEAQAKRYGSPTFYDLLRQMEIIHSKKSHDYAKDNDLFANYKFAGLMAKLFNNADDAGFIGRIGEKLYRLANLENSGKNPANEPVEDTEVDLCVIMALWVAMRRDRRNRGLASQVKLDPRKY
jgi:hypothetical protein